MTADPPLPLDRRQALFRALVEAQDAGDAPPDSWPAVAVRFGVTVATVRAVEAEGVENDWPPL